MHLTYYLIFVQHEHLQLWQRHRQGAQLWLVQAIAIQHQITQLLKLGQPGEILETIVTQIQVLRNLRIALHHLRGQRA